MVIGKKGDTSYCCNNRGITLRATSSKVLKMVLLKRLDVGMECLLRENQCGFSRNPSCIAIRFIPSAPLLITVLNLTFHYIFIC